MSSPRGPSAIGGEPRPYPNARPPRAPNLGSPEKVAAPSECWARPGVSRVAKYDNTSSTRTVVTNWVD